ncbi:PhzF family phenazine biosynthesis protein [Maribacter chungangensis]|uniref:PhzF family phenazine biosynthesis protein n=1 Tax=Maribacter chungangensis TaxID=1069117 RepID=A0ABW3B0M4_9FLAO
MVDSFTDKPFKGNPASACLLNQTLSDEQMKTIAKELGLLETAFITQIKNQDKYSIRYFSPVMEIPLCGHATLAASKVLFEINPKINTVHFKYPKFGFNDLKVWSKN